MKRSALLSLLLAAPFLAASIPPPPEDPADIRTTEERIGAFQLELEEYRDTGPWATNPPRQWKKVRQIWRSGDGLSEIQVEDNGYTLSRSYTLRSADRMNVCMGVGGLSQYGRPGTAASLRAYARDYLDFLESCRIEPARHAAYEAELRLALPDLAAAGSRLRSLATAAFGGLAPRCIRFRKRLLDPMFRKCTRFSKPFLPGDRR
jgi:hypothetical protein